MGRVRSTAVVLLLAAGVPPAEAQTGEGSLVSVPLRVEAGRLVVDAVASNGTELSLVVSTGVPETDRLAELLLSADQIRVGLAGNLADYEFVDRNGNLVTGAGVDYNGAPSGYTGDPQEHISYASAHDNQTLFDVS